MINPWVTLKFPNGTAEGPLWGNLWIDNTGVWGGDMIVAANSGDIWKVTPEGTYSLVADVDTNVEGLTTVPDDPAEYGPLAGCILTAVGDNNTIDTLFAINTAGTVTTYPLQYTVNGTNIKLTNIENLNVVPPNANFYGLDIGQNLLLGAPASEFTSMVGDILVVAEVNSSSRQHHRRDDGPVSLSLERHQLRPDPGAAGHRLGPAASSGKATGSPPFGAIPIPPSQPTTGLPNWPINLENSGGTVIASTTTDARGNYSFTNVAAGTYTVAEVPQSGWTQFAPRPAPTS